MNNGLSIGRIFGVQITIDPSWLIIFLLIVWQLAAGVFPIWHPGWAPSLNWGIAILAALLLFASVIAHELAHSLVAISQDLPVRRITLFLFGGVSNIQREPQSAGIEFMVAVVGPITSLVIGVVCLFLAGVSAFSLQGVQASPSQLFAQLGPSTTLLVWLGQINLLLGLFNLIPGFPLDGGRILRSILWAISGNLRRATRWAVGVGHVVAWILIIAGISMIFGARLPVFGEGILGGLWLTFIGWFLNNAAASSYKQAVLRDVLEGVPVSRLMHSQVDPISPNVSISTLVDARFMQSDERAYPVMQDEKLVGVVSLADVRKVSRADWPATHVDKIMTPAQDLDITAPGEDAVGAVMKLAEHDVDQMPVVRNGHLEGMLRRRDVVKWLQLHSDAVLNP